VDDDDEYVHNQPPPDPRAGVDAAGQQTVDAYQIKHVLRARVGMDLCLFIRA
jgi:hypothetical protein